MLLKHLFHIKRSIFKNKEQMRYVLHKYFPSCFFDTGYGRFPFLFPFCPMFPYEVILIFIVKHFYYGKFQTHIKIEITVQQNSMNPLDNSKHFNSKPILFCLYSYLLLSLLPDLRMFVSHS